MRSLLAWIKEREGLMAKRYKGTFLEYGNILYLNCGGGY